MKRTLALVLGVLVVAFAAGCSDDSGDDDSGAISCNSSAAGVCASGRGTAAECTDGGGTVVDACPSGALLTCEQTNGTFYLYNQTFVDALKAGNATDPCSAYTAG